MTAYRDNLQLWVREALAELGGEGAVIQVAKLIWASHEDDLKQAGDAFYTWQYDLRWAADTLRRKGSLGLRKEGSRSVWTLKK